MIRINLLPPSIETRGRVRDQIIIFLIVLGIIAGAMIWLRSYMIGIIDELNANIEKTQTELNNEKKKLAEIEKISKEIATIEKKLEVIAALNKRRREAFRLLDTLTGMVVENRMWLTGFQALERVKTITKGTGKDATKEVVVEVEITVDGIALDNKTVADFMTRLEEAKDPEGIFKITEETLSKLKDEKLPESLIKQLETLKDKDYKGDKEMIAALNDTVGKEPAERYKGVILNHSGEEYYTEENLVVVRQEIYGNINMKKFQIICKNLPLKKKPETAPPPPPPKGK